MRKIRQNDNRGNFLLTHDGTQSCAPGLLCPEKTFFSANRLGGVIIVAVDTAEIGISRTHAGGQKSNILLFIDLPLKLIDNSFFQIKDLISRGRFGQCSLPAVNHRSQSSLSSPALPVIVSASNPAYFRKAPKWPPKLETPGIWVNGDREIAIHLLVPGNCGMPPSGPDEKISGFPGSYADFAGVNYFYATNKAPILCHR